jgi:nucleotide-binding universal stress UspA family protein
MLANASILVPLDFSRLSQKAVPVAVKIAQLFDGKITPFHVNVPITEIDEPFAAHMRYDFEKMEKETSHHLDELAKELIPDEVRAPAKVVFGNPAQDIAEQGSAMDLIVMSSHGRTGFSRMLIGSVAEKVLRLSKTPVLVVEEESDVDNFSRILVTTDFSENSRAAFPYAIELAKKTNAQVELLHVLSFGQLDRDETDDFVEDLREERLKLVKSEYFHEIGDQVTTTVLSTESSPHQAIVEYFQKHPAHMVIMSTVGRTGLNYLMLGSTTANVVRHIPQAVLSVRPVVTS